MSTRTSEEKRILVHYYRIKDHLDIKKLNGKDTLFFRGEEVLTKEGSANEIKRQLHEQLGTGARCVRQTLKGKYTCFGERKVRKFIRNDKILSKINARFTNKPPLKTVQASRVFEKVQVDLITIKNNIVEYNGRNYRYILSLIDVLSRYTICKQLLNKSGREVRKAMEEIIF